MNEEYETSEKRPDLELTSLSQIAQAVSTASEYPQVPKELKDEEKQMSRFEKSTLRWAQVAVIMSGLAALGVFGQLFIMHKTLDEMKQGGEQSTKQMRSAIGNMNWMARTADGSLHQTEEAMKVNRQQSIDYLNATINNFHDEQRSWLSIQTVQIPISQITPGWPDQNGIFATL